MPFPWAITSTPKRRDQRLSGGVASRNYFRKQVESIFFLILFAEIAELMKADVIVMFLSTQCKSVKGLTFSVVYYYYSSCRSCKFVVTELFQNLLIMLVKAQKRGLNHVFKETPQKIIPWSVKAAQKKKKKI